MEVRAMDKLRKLFEDKRFILLFSMIVSSIAIILSRTLISVPGMRFELGIAPVLSLLLGPYATLGFIIVELISIFIIHTQKYQSLFFIGLLTFICNFAVWKLWYSSFNKYGYGVPNINGLYNMTKFGVILFSYPLIAYSLFILLINANIIDLKITVRFLMTFPISFILSAIFIYFANKYRIPLYTPKRQFKKILPEKIYPILIVLFFVLIGIINLQVGNPIYGTIMNNLQIGNPIYGTIMNNLQVRNTFYKIILEIICFSLIVIYLLKPYEEEVFKISNYKKLNTFSKVNISIFMITITLFLTLAVLPNYLVDLILHLEYDELVYSINLDLLLLVLIMVVPTTIYMFFLERKVTKPTNKLSKTLSHEISTREGYLKHKAALESIHPNNEISILVDSLLHMENNLIEYEENLVKVTSEKERYETELKLGSDIQNSMIPKDFEEFYNGFDETKQNKYDFNLWGHMKAAREVGGDFYDYFKIDDETVGFAMGDVSGKGIPAALIMVKAMTLIQDFAKEYNELSKVFREVNKLLYEDNEEGLFVNSLLGKINLKNGEMSFVNAGYQQPLIRLNGNDFEYSTNFKSQSLSKMKDADYETHTIKLNKGDAIFLYSDSIFETENENGEPYEKRLKEVLNMHKEDGTRLIIESIEKDMNEFSNNKEQIDDVTMFAIELNK